MKTTEENHARKGAQHLIIEAVCIGCGCTDSRACEDCCSWLRADYDAGIGVCSNCEEHTLRWDRGEWGLTDTAQAKVEGLIHEEELLREFREDSRVAQAMGEAVGPDNEPS